MTTAKNSYSLVQTLLLNTYCTITVPLCYEESL